MNNGYPSTASIVTALSGVGIEEITDNNNDFREEYLQQLWAIVNSVRWAFSLAVYCPSTLTFNVIGGDYIFDGTAKVFTPGAAINPADNDTTYVWMKNDNTIGHGVDGSGWPAGAHIKLAEIDVNSAGVITAVRDRRGASIMRYSST